MRFAEFKKNINNFLTKTNKRRMSFHLLSSFTGLLCLVFFLSCTNGMTENPEQEVLQNVKDINIKITSDDGYILFNQDYFPQNSQNNSRTILPSYSYSDYVFYLEYENINSKNDSGIIEKMNFTPLDKNIGFISYTFKKQYYKLTLYALTKEISNSLETSETTSLKLQQNASLKASTFVDMRYEEEIFFHLKENTLSVGKGSVELTISHLNDWQVDGDFKINCGIYSIDDGSLVYPSENGPFELRTTQGAPSSLNDITFSSFGNDTTKTNQNVPVGNYDFVVNYIKCDAEGNEKKVYKYSEKITVLINQTTKADFLIPDFLDKKPEAPSDFTAALKFPEAGEKISADENNFYKVQFYWKDNSKNEELFELELLKVDSDSQITSNLNDDTWNGMDENSTFIPVSEDYTGTSLSENFVRYERSLLLGSRYVARVRAVNGMGESNWAYISFPTLQELTDKGISFDEGFSAITSEAEGDVTTINLYRINYEFSGGSLSAIQNGVTVSEPAPVLYGSQHNTNHNSQLIFYPDGESCEYIWKNPTPNEYKTVQDATISLTSGENKWTHWTQNTFIDTVIINRSNPYTYQGYKNIIFFAHYENEESLTN